MESDETFDLVNECQEKAQNGDLYCITQLAQYYESLGNTELMLRYYELGASHNDIFSIYNLAKYYDNIGNIPEMLKYYKLGFELGDPDCEYELEQYYENTDEKVKFYRMRADAGDIDYIHKLSIYYESEMVKYYRMGAEKKDIDCILKLARYYHSMNEIEEMEFYYKLGSDLDDLECLYELGKYYENEERYNEMKLYYLKLIALDQYENYNTECFQALYYILNEEVANLGSALELCTYSIIYHSNLELVRDYDINIVDSNTNEKLNKDDITFNRLVLFFKNGRILNGICFDKQKLLEKLNNKIYYDNKNDSKYIELNLFGNKKLVSLSQLISMMINNSRFIIINDTYTKRQVFRIDYENYEEEVFSRENIHKIESITFVDIM